MIIAVAASLVLGPKPYLLSRNPPCAARRRSVDVLRRDVVAECGRRGLPKPDVEVVDYASGTNGRIAALLHLNFTVGIAGPLLLGRDSHQGGGLFLAKADR
jgi:CRISPR-associated protein Csb2